MGNDSIIAFRTREQLRKCPGMFSPQFKGNRRKMEFLGQVLFGMQASRDMFVSEIARRSRRTCSPRRRRSGWSGA